MSPIIARAPTSQEDEQALRFRTYLNYVENIAGFLRTTYPKSEDVVREIATSDTFCKIQRQASCDHEAVTRLLRNAWLTEVQMWLHAGMSDLVPYTNHWTPVQLYYSVYLATRAFLEAKCQVVSDHHTATLRALSGDIRSRPRLFPLPWRVLCSGVPGSTCTYENLPPNTSIGTVSGLSADAPVWDSLAMLLRTTRERQAEKAVDDWKTRQKKRRIPAAERNRLASHLPPTSLFDVMYRLRIRSNYADADAFLLTLSSRDEALRFSKSVRLFGWFTMLVLECITCRYLGSDVFRQAVERFVGHDVGRHSHNLVRFRWNVIARHL